MPFQIGVDSPKCKQMLAPDESQLCPGGIENWGSMAFRQYEFVVGRIAGILRIEVHDREK
jgi:hypothetical protein